MIHKIAAILNITLDSANLVPPDVASGNKITRKDITRTQQHTNARKSAKLFRQTLILLVLFQALAGIRQRAQ